jgi:hypothetical protein
MKTLYQGATCKYCVHSIKPTEKKCGPCLSRDGRPGFKPGEWAELRPVQVFAYDSKGREVQRTVQRVVGA